MLIDVRSALRWATRGKSFEVFVATLEQFQRKSNLLRVLTYHRVDNLATRPELSPRALSATPASFAEQMEFLAENYNVISVETLLEVQRSQGRLPERSVLITFDDAYRDFAEHAWPILRRFDLPAVLFVPTAYPDNPELHFWWDRLFNATRAAKRERYELGSDGTVQLNTQAQRESAYRSLSDQFEKLPHRHALEFVDQVCEELAAPEVDPPVLGWDELKSIAGPKLALAPHTRTHPLLDRITTAEAREEILGSLDDLQREIGQSLPVFAYPGGAITSDIVEMLKNEGFQLAFTTRRGMNDWDHANHLQLNRINVGHRCSFGLWRSQLLGMSRHLMR